MKGQHSESRRHRQSFNSDRILHGVEYVDIQIFKYSDTTHCAPSLLPKYDYFPPFFLFLLSSGAAIALFPLSFGSNASFISFCNFSYSPVKYWPKSSNSSLEITPSSFSS